MPPSRVPSHAVELSQGTYHEQPFRAHILASRSALSMQCSFCGALAMHMQLSECTLCMQCRFRGYLHMQWSSLRAHTMNSHSEPTFEPLAVHLACSAALVGHLPCTCSFQSIHFACSAAFAGTFTCSAALSGHVPRTAIQSSHSSLSQYT